MINWKPISEAPEDETLLLYSPEFEDEDFNPSGIVDGFYNADFGWTCWRWNGCQDCYDTITEQNPTLFAEKIKPNLEKK